jgi:hypothetical protein
MVRERNEGRLRAIGVLRETLGLGAPALLALSLVLLFRAPDSSAAAQADPQVREVPRLCERPHEDQGEVRRIDLAVLTRGYEDLKSRMEVAFSRATMEAGRTLAGGYESGLPACRARALREIELERLVPPALRGKKLYFARAHDPARIDLLPALEGTKDLLVFILSASEVRNLAGVSKALDRPVSLASAEFARSLGVRCGNTWLEVDGEGRKVVLHEGD